MPFNTSNQGQELNSRFLLDWDPAYSVEMQARLQQGFKTLPLAGPLNLPVAKAFPQATTTSRFFSPATLGSINDPTQNTTLVEQGGPSYNYYGGGSIYSLIAQATSDNPGGQIPNVKEFVHVENLVKGITLGASAIQIDRGSLKIGLERTANGYKLYVAEEDPVDGDQTIPLEECTQSAADRSEEAVAGDFLLVGGDGEPLWDDSYNLIWADSEEGEFPEAASYYDAVLIANDGVVLVGGGGEATLSVLVGDNSQLVGAEEMWLVSDSYGMLRNNSYNLLATE